MIVIDKSIFRFNARKKLILSWIIVALWLMLIFSFSAQPVQQSDGLSKGVTRTIIEFIAKILPLNVETDTSSNFIAAADHVVRKTAHGSVYFVLGLLLVNAFRQTGVKGKKVFFYAMLFCVCYAATDEFHQNFVSGRGPRVTDVLIDSCGAFLAVELSFWIAKFRKLRVRAG